MVSPYRKTCEIHLVLRMLRTGGLSATRKLNKAFKRRFNTITSTILLRSSQRNKMTAMATPSWSPLSTIEIEDSKFQMMIISKTMPNRLAILNKINEWKLKVELEIETGGKDKKFAINLTILTTPRPMVATHMAWKTATPKYMIAMFTVTDKAGSILVSCS